MSLTGERLQIEIRNTSDFDIVQCQFSLQMYLS